VDSTRARFSERDEKEDAEAKADLGDAHDRAGEMRADAEFRRDRGDERLRIIDIGGERAGGDRKQKGKEGGRRLLGFGHRYGWGG